MMSPGDAQKMTSYLFGLGTPQAVQAAAAKNQHDISFVALASSVAAAMKNVMTPQAAPPQGTVMQQTVQQMAPPQQAPQQMTPPQQMPQQMPQQLPENSGIGQLNPGQGVQSMAGGGITGEPRVQHFAKKGLVPQTSESIQAQLADETAERPYVGLGQLLKPLAQSNIDRSGDIPAEGVSDIYSNTAVPEQPAYTTRTGFGGVNTDQGVTAVPVAKKGAAPAPTPAPASAPAGPARGDGGPAGLGGLAGIQKALTDAGLGAKTYAENYAAMRYDANPYQGTDPGITVRTHSANLLSAAKEMGLNPENKPAFDRLSKLQTQADELLERKQNLAIIQGGLAMIRPGHWATAIAQGAGEGIGKYSSALDAHQASMGKLEDSRALLDTAKNTMNMTLFGKAVDKHENALKEFQSYLRDTSKDAVAQTEGQARNVASLVAAVHSGQITLEHARIVANSQKDLYGLRAAQGAEKLSRVDLIAANKDIAKEMEKWRTSPEGIMAAKTPGLEQTKAMEVENRIHELYRIRGAQGKIQPGEPTKALN
jgi:hypothetical protein